MRKHILIELQKIIEVRIGSLIEEVEIATNLKLNPPCIIDLEDEIASLQWVTRIIKWVLDRAIDGRQRLEITKSVLELEDTKKIENMLHDKIQVLEIELEDSNTAREKEVLLNGIDTLKCVMGHLFNLKPGGDEIRAMETEDAHNDFQQTHHGREELNKIQVTEAEVNSRIQVQRQ
jgi:hypothetical protein